MHDFEISRANNANEAILFCKKCGESYILSMEVKGPSWEKMPFKENGKELGQPGASCSGGPNIR